MCNFMLHPDQLGTISNLLERKNKNMSGEIFWAIVSMIAFAGLLVKMVIDELKRR